MKEETKRDANIKNENDRKFFLDISPLLKVAVESRSSVFEGYKFSVQDRKSGCQRPRMYLAHPWIYCHHDFPVGEGDGFSLESSRVIRASLLLLNFLTMIMAMARIIIPATTADKAVQVTIVPPTRSEIGLQLARR